MTVSTELSGAIGAAIDGSGIELGAAGGAEAGDGIGGVTFTLGC